jgi:hypothetical protein
MSFLTIPLLKLMITAEKSTVNMLDDYFVSDDFDENSISSTFL